MDGTTKQVISGILAGLISSGTAVLALAADLPDGAGLGDISSVAWLTIGVGGALSVFKDWKTLLAPSPK